MRADGLCPAAIASRGRFRRISGSRMYLDLGKLSEVWSRRTPEVVVENVAGRCKV